MLHFILYFSKSSLNAIELLEKKVLHMLSVRFDNDADVSIVLFDVSEVESPVGMYNIQSLLVLALEEHISLVANVVGAQKCSKGFLQVEIL